MTLSSHSRAHTKGSKPTQSQWECEKEGNKPLLEGFALDLQDKGLPGCSGSVCTTELCPAPPGSTRAGTPGTAGKALLPLLLPPALSPPSPGLCPSPAEPPGPKSAKGGGPRAWQEISCLSESVSFTTERRGVRRDSSACQEATAAIQEAAGLEKNLSFH